ncbi:MAG: HAMP domain-containing histidine kinase [Actinomycetota bacterium]|nr:HAMP domain-containing histidine kinase [Actinomycetota bacterium]
MRRRSLGLRGRVMLTFTVGAALVSLLLAVSVFTISRGYLLDQRERSAQRLATSDADFVASRLAVPGSTAAQAIAAVDPPASTELILHRDGAWVSSRGVDPVELPPEELRAQVAAGERALVSATVRGSPFLVVGVPMHSGWEFYEFAPITELVATIRILGTVLIICAAVATAGAALLGLWASRRVLQPLHALAGTAASIAGGNLDSKLPEEGDRDLTTFVASFNSMVASLRARIERERRFVGDVTHELRTPLTTLVTSVEVMRKQAGELPERSQRALALVSTELDHLRRMLDDLLALARTEAGLHHDELESLSLRSLLVNSLAASGRATDLLDTDVDGMVSGRKLALVRAFTNLMDNADQHGGGLARVLLLETADTVVVHVDDDGPGVPPDERERIFARFATGQGARGSSAGTGLGLALVTETLIVHNGQVECADSPSGGARFTVTLPHSR